MTDWKPIAVPTKWRRISAEIGQYVQLIIDGHNLDVPPSLQVKICQILEGRVEERLLSEFGIKFSCGDRRAKTRGDWNEFPRFKDVMREKEVTAVILNAMYTRKKQKTSGSSKRASGSSKRRTP